MTQRGFQRNRCYETIARNNDDGDKTGLEVVQDSAGAGTLTVRASKIADGIDPENVNIIEE